MKDVDQYLSSSRREFLTAVGAAGATALAGCSDQGGSETSEPTDDSTPEDDTPVDGTESGQGTSDTQTTDERDTSDLYEEDEPEIEQERESTFTELYDGWIEMENPSEQMPEENYDFDEFPNLQILDEIGVYSTETEAIYLGWADTGERVELSAFEVTDYEEGTSGGSGTSGSAQYTDQSADVGRILEEVIEGVDDVSEDIDDEYAEILLQY